MKKLTLCLMLVSCASFLRAQSVGLDTTFGVQGLVETGLLDINMNPYGNNMVVYPNGEVVIIGDNDESLAIEKYGNNGLLDVPFTTSLPNFSEYIFGLSTQQDGKVIACGRQKMPPYHASAIRLNSNGGMDPTFGTSGIADVFLGSVDNWRISGLSNGNILAYGTQSYDTSSYVIATRLYTTGSIDSTFGENGLFRLHIPPYGEYIKMGLEQPDGKFLFAGMVNREGLLLRINQDGTIDSTFNKDGILIDTETTGLEELFCLRLQPDGKIVAGGYARTSWTSFKSVVVRYHPNGDRDSTFGINGAQYFMDYIGVHEVIGLEVLPNGKIIMVISDFSSGKVTLAQLLSNGQMDPSFAVNGIYQHPQETIRSRSFSSNGNKVTVSGTKWQQKIYLVRFLLDLNVGTLNPSDPADPSLWIYPNPVAEQFTMEFGLKQQEHVSIQLFDMNGKQVQSFVQNQPFEQGEHSIQLSCAEQLASGDYVLTLEVAGKKMTSIQIMKK